MRWYPSFISHTFVFKSLSKLLILLCWLMPCADALANCLKNTNIQLFGKKHTHCRTLSVLPIRLMDNDTLFLSAAAQRDHRMNAVNKLLNNRWLLQSKQNTFSGPRALRTALRMSLVNAWRSKQAQRSKFEEKSENNKGEQYQQMPLFDINNYNISISGEKMTLGFSYRF